MSITWMVVIGVLVFGQRLLPAKSAVDLPLPLAITGLGVLIVSTPSPVPGLSPPMWPGHAVGTTRKTRRGE
jgi:hypothetical protein